MSNNPMIISFSNNSSSSNSEFMSFSDPFTSSSSMHSHHTPPSTTNQTLDHVPLATPPSKRPRGRPPGSKNKPKPNLIHVPQPPEPKKPIIVNVPKGRNVIEYIVNVARRNHVSVTVLSATGHVSYVTLCHKPCGAEVVALHGPFTLISLNGSYIHNKEYTLHPGATPPSNISFGINLVTSDGQVFGGVASGKIVADTSGVQVVLSPFNNPSIYTHVPGGEETNEDNNTNVINFSGFNNVSGYNIVQSKIPGW